MEWLGNGPLNAIAIRTSTCFKATYTVSEVDNAKQTARGTDNKTMVDMLHLLRKRWTRHANGCDLHLLLKLPLVLRRASIPAPPSRIILVQSPPHPCITTMSVSGVVLDFDGIQTDPTPGTTSSFSVAVAQLVNGMSFRGGGVEVIADHVDNNDSITPTPSPLLSLGRTGKGGVDVHAKREATANSGTPTPPSGTPPLTFDVRVSAAGSLLPPQAFFVDDPAPGFLLPMHPPPPPS